MNSDCPRDQRHRCSTKDANTCRGGGCDEPCDCIVCHPTTVTLPDVIRWCDEHVKTRETVSILRAYRNDCRAETDRAEQEQAKVIEAMRAALIEANQALEEGREYQGEILEVSAKVRAALKLAGVTL